MKATILFPVLASCLLIMSCSENPKKVKYNPYEITSNSGNTSSYEIPFKTTSSNVKTIHIKLNDVEGVDAIFDTGCSGLLLSKLEAARLIKAGTLTDNNYVNTAASSIADGSVIMNEQYEIGVVSVTDLNGIVHSVSNVVATVVDNAIADVLVGNTVIDQLATTGYTIDIANSVIRFQ